jgi:hypothetical protein
MAASVQQRLACGERAGHKVRRLGAGLGSAGEAPKLPGPRCASVNGFSLHANTAFSRTDGIRWNASSALLPAGPCRWSG